MHRISIVNCSENNSDEIKRIVDLYSNYFKANDIESFTIPIAVLRIASCIECKACMQTPGYYPTSVFIVITWMILLIC